MLDPVAVSSDDGVPVDIPGARLRMLLARLALEEGRLVHTDTLVDDLWGEQPPAVAVVALQGLVSRLRNILGASGSVDFAAGGYRLSVRAEDVDVHRFEERGLPGSAAVPVLPDGEAVTRRPSPRSSNSAPVISKGASRLPSRKGSLGRYLRSRSTSLTRETVSRGPATSSSRSHEPARAKIRNTATPPWTPPTRAYEVSSGRLRVARNGVTVLDSQYSVDGDEPAPGVGQRAAPRCGHRPVDILLRGRRAPVALTRRAGFPPSTGAVYPGRSGSPISLSDDQERRGLRDGDVEGVVQRAWVERAKCFVEDEEFGILEQGPGQEDQAAFAVGELPAGFADDLCEAGWHAVDQVAEAQ